MHNGVSVFLLILQMKFIESVKFCDIISLINIIFTLTVDVCH